MFSLIETDGLAQDLALYLPGISATLTFASLAVRPLFLDLIEEHVLRLPITALRPALKALILSILPGLEEETSEDFERAMDILNTIKNLFAEHDAVGFFWQCLFLASITSPSRRIGVLSYLSRYLPKLGQEASLKTSATNGGAGNTASAEAAAAVTSPEPGLLVRCFATGLVDEQILVQRSFLDLLVTHLPLNADVYQSSVISEDLDLLVSCAVGVVLRRDMSLNRRLWSWFLGSETQADVNGDTAPQSPDEPKKAMSGTVDENQGTGSSMYFFEHGSDPLVRSLQSMISRNSLLPSERARPFRIALSLMDRWEIGGSVVTSVFLSLLRSVQEFKKSAGSKEQYDEVFRSASVFFDGVESSLIWSEMLHLVSDAGMGDDELDEHATSNLDLALFIVTNFNIREEEMLLIHVPLVALALLSLLSEVQGNMDSPRSSDSRDQRFAQTLELLRLLLEIIPDTAFTSGTSLKEPRPGTSAPSLKTTDIIHTISSFYKKSQDGLELPSLPFSGVEIANLMLRQAAAMVLSQVEGSIDSKRLDDPVQIFLSLIAKTSCGDVLVDLDFTNSLLQRLTTYSNSTDTAGLPFALVSSLSSIISVLWSLEPRYSIVSRKQFLKASRFLSGSSGLSCLH